MPPKILLYIFAVTGVIAGVLVGALAFVSLVAQNKSARPVPAADVPQENIALNTNAPVVPDGDRVNMLFLGYGGTGHSGGTLMDSIIVISVDKKTKKAALISIPRDLSFPFPTDYNNTSNHKINEGFAIAKDAVNYPNKKPEFRHEPGGWNLMEYAASTVTGLPIESFVAVDFGQFEKIVSDLGGIQADVPKVYDDYFYPVRGRELELCGKSAQEVAELHQKYSGFELEKQFICRYEHIHFDKGKVQMDGATALKYVRSRHGDGDFGRSERQFVVLQAIADKVISRDIVSKGGAALSDLFSLVQTNQTATSVKALADLLGNPKDYQVTSIHLTEGNVLAQSTGASGAYMLVPREGVNKWTAIQNYIFGKL